MTIAEAHHPFRARWAYRGKHGDRQWFYNGDAGLTIRETWLMNNPRRDDLWSLRVELNNGQHIIVRPNAWRSMEDAPRDGTRVELRLIAGAYRRYTFARIEGKGWRFDDGSFLRSADARNWQWRPAK